MTPQTLKFLHDMLDAADAVTHMTAGISREQYLENRTTRDAVLWNLTVIGEALAQLKKWDEETAGRITDAKRIVRLRNQLIHGYGFIDHTITWRIVVDKLPVLQAELQVLLSEDP